MPKEVIRTGQAPKAIGPYSQAVLAGGVLYASGQIGLDPATGELVQGGFEAEARRVLVNLQAVAVGAGMTMADAVRLTVYLVDLADFARLNEIFSSVLVEPYPARATVEVAALPRGARVEIDMIAIKGGKD
ncbi:MAG TPA: RidA family protein [Candidatus Binatia bacterium]|jgi:reactive intermediate/imine deaminase